MSLCLYFLAHLLRGFARLVEVLTELFKLSHEGDIVFKLRTLSHEFQFLPLHTHNFLPVVVLFVSLNIFTPKVVRVIEHLINVLFFVDQVELQLVFIYFY